MELKFLVCHIPISLSHAHQNILPNSLMNLPKPGKQNLRNCLPIQIQQSSEPDPLIHGYQHLQDSPKSKHADQSPTLATRMFIATRSPGLDLRRFPSFMFHDMTAVLCELSISCNTTLSRLTLKGCNFCYQTHPRQARTYSDYLFCFGGKRSLVRSSQRPRQGPDC